MGQRSEMAHSAVVALAFPAWAWLGPGEQAKRKCNLEARHRRTGWNLLFVQCLCGRFQWRFLRLPAGLMVQSIRRGRGKWHRNQFQRWEPCTTLYHVRSERNYDTGAHVFAE